MFSSLNKNGTSFNTSINRFSYYCIVCCWIDVFGYLYIQFNVAFNAPVSSHVLVLWANEI